MPTSAEFAHDHYRENTIRIVQFPCAEVLVDALRLAGKYELETLPGKVCERFILSIANKQQGISHVVLAWEQAKDSVLHANDITATLDTSMGFEAVLRALLPKAEHQAFIKEAVENRSSMRAWAAAQPKHRPLPSLHHFPIPNKPIALKRPELVVDPILLFE